jgi:ubiquinone/menaquinone biosynthesis C-methylase UbiE
MRPFVVARVYDRMAPLYDWLEAPMEAMGGRARRRRVIERAQGLTLEVGVGTGRNLPLYPQGVQLTAVDISARMLVRARHRGKTLGRTVEYVRAAAEALPFRDGTFATATATCVFCSVEHPIRGLEEVSRVVRPDGTVLLLEHVRPTNPVLAKIFDWLSPLTRRIFGPEINRRTEENVVAAGLAISHVRRNGIWREIVARLQSPRSSQPHLR